MSWIGQWVQEKAAEYLKAGVQAGGTVAGNAVGGVGSLVEDSGRSLGQGVTGGINSVGDYINGYGANIKNSLSADGPVHRAASKPTQRSTAPFQRQNSKPESKVINRSLSSTARTAPALVTKISKPPAGRVGSQSRHSPSAKAISPGRTAPKPSRIGAGIETLKTQQRISPASALQSGRSPDGKVIISTASKPKSLSAAGNQARPPGNRNGPKTGPARTSLPSDQKRTKPNGKVVISAESRPKQGPPCDSP